jgi:hypothetical protein
MEDIQAILHPVIVITFSYSMQQELKVEIGITVVNTSDKIPTQLVYNYEHNPLERQGS